MGKSGRGGMDRFDYEAVMKLLDMARGERSFRQYAIDAGVSSANIYRIRNKDYRPSPEMLRKLTSEKARPRDGVTFSMLMKAAGYQDYCDEESFEESEFYGYEKQSEGLILKALLDQNISYSKSDVVNDDAIVSINKPDLFLTIKNKRIKKWWMEFKCLKEASVNKSYYDHLVPTIFGRLMMIAPDKDRKISIVVNSKNFFGKLIRYKEQLPYKGELSIILLDLDNYCVEDEIYISNYDDYHDKELYIK